MIPAFILVVIAIVIFGVWATVSILDFLDNNNIMSLIFCILSIISVICLLVTDYNNIDSTEIIKDIIFIDNKAVISIDGNILWVSKKTGESYKLGDKIKFNFKNSGTKVLIWHTGNEERINNIQKVEE